MIDDSLKARFLEVLLEGGPQDVDAFLDEHAGSDAGLRDELDAVRGAHETLGGNGGASQGGHTPVDVAPLPTGLAGELDDYELLDELGRGGMGDVFRARERSTERIVALKIFRASASTESTRERFRREAQILASLNCPGIVTLYRFGVAGSSPFLAMELVEGRTLEALIDDWRERSDSERYRRAARIIMSACATIDSVHARGVIHRDLKPSNICVTEREEVWIIDFGLALGLDSTQLTQSGASVGTVMYMSPEQLRAGRENVDRRSDVYSLGATLYEAATLHPPFESDGAPAAVARILQSEPPAPAVVDAGVPPDLAAIIETAMDADPARRYATSGDMALDLRRFIADEPTIARPLTPWTRLGKRLRRRKRTMTVALSVLVLALVGAAALIELGSRRLRAGAVQSALSDSARGRGRAALLREELAFLRERITGAESEASSLDRFEERAELLEAKRREATVRTRLEEASHDAVLALLRGLEVAPRDPDLRGRLESLLWQRFVEAESAGNETAKRSAAQLLMSHFPSSETRLVARGELHLTSDPPGAQVFLFRYESAPPFRNPVPHDGKRALESDIEDAPPLLIVKPVTPLLHAAGLRQGDRIVALDGRPVGLSGNRLIETFQPIHEPRPIEIERDGRRISLLLNGCLNRECTQRPADHLNWVCELDPFPLACTEANRVGVTPLTLEGLEGGSWLALVRAPGHPDTRVPFRVERDGALEIDVRLFTPAEIPPGFVHVPAGEAILGGDPAALYAEPERRIHLDDYFIARYEVTFAEYLAFCEDVRASFGPSPTAAKNAELEALLPIEEQSRGQKRWYRVDEEGRIGPRSFGEGNGGARHVTQLAAQRYVAWRNARERERGGRWTFALPSANELEKAARGADGRLFPWGDGFDWSLVCSHRSTRSDWARRFHFPTDSSPYDVRNLAGYVAEWTRTDEMPPGAIPNFGEDTVRPETMDCRVKGGSGFDDLQAYFRLGGHTRERKRSPHYRIGFRLVAYPRSPAGVSSTREDR